MIVSTSGTLTLYPRYLSQFTGDAGGLDHFGDRLYDPSTGRFLQPDPETTPTDPQGWSPYTYASDDPINSTDITGHCPTGLCWAAHAVRWLNHCGWGNIFHHGVVGACTRWGRRFEQNAKPWSFRKTMAVLTGFGTGMSCRELGISIGARLRAAPELAAPCVLLGAFTCAYEGYHWARSLLHSHG